MTPKVTITVPTKGGLAVIRKGDRVRAFASRKTHARLLNKQPGFEVIEVRVEAGGRLFLTPPESSDERCAEVYHVTSGCFELSGKNQKSLLEPGDSVTVGVTAERAVLSTLHGATLLCVSNQPVFSEADTFTGDLMRLAVEVEEKDGYTSEHCARLRDLSNATARNLALDVDQCYRLSYGAYLHDVGKLKVPLDILQKPTSLTPEEWAVIKQHPTYGRELLGGTLLADVGVIVEQHHERMDGSGYPYGLSHGEILTESYIVAVADTYDAMTTDRPYRAALAPAVAFAELEKFADVHYPREVVCAFRAAVAVVEPV